MNARCAAAFAGAHFCHASEYWLSNSATPPPATGAWIDSSASIDNGDTVVSTFIGSQDFGIYTGKDSNCLSWTTAVPTNGPMNGPTVSSTGTRYVDCGTQLPLACCSTPYRERFAGFTSWSSSGAIGGEAAANYHCATEFAGSHLCHLAEYYRAHPMQSPPQIGAWVDASVVPWYNYNGYSPCMDAAIARAGRLLSNGYSCTIWTATSGNGTAVLPSGLSGPTCSTTHPLACCQ